MYGEWWRLSAFTTVLFLHLIPYTLADNPSNTFTANAQSNGTSALPTWRVGDNVTVSWSTWFQSAKLVYLPQSRDSYYTIYTIPSSSTNSFSWTVNVSNAAGWGSADPTIYLGILDSSGQSFFSNAVNVVPVGEPLPASANGTIGTISPDGSGPLLSTGAVIGISLGGAVVALAAIFGVLMLCRKRIDRWAVAKREREWLIPPEGETRSRDRSPSKLKEVGASLFLSGTTEKRLKRSGDSSGDYSQPPQYEEQGAMTKKNKGNNKSTVNVTTKALPPEPPLGMSARVTGPLVDENDYRDLPGVISSRAGQGRKQTRRGRAELRTVEKPQELDDTELIDVMIMPGSPRSVWRPSGQPMLAWARSLRRPSAFVDGYRERREYHRERMARERDRERDRQEKDQQHLGMVQEEV